VLKQSKQNTTPVHYKPSNPGESVLEPFIPELVCISRIINILIIVACGFGLPNDVAKVRRSTIS
jgi:hypothetical protein